MKEEQTAFHFVKNGTTVLFHKQTSGKWNAYSENCATGKQTTISRDLEPTEVEELVVLISQGHIRKTNDDLGIFGKPATKIKANLKAFIEKVKSPNG
jgi:hypothetical protein